MYKSIILAFVMIFFVTGLTAVISWLLIKAACPDRKMRFFVVCPLYKNDSECCVKISCVLSVLTVLGLVKRCRIMAVDCGMDEYEKELLYSAFSGTETVIICKNADITEKISENSTQVP